MREIPSNPYSRFRPDIEGLRGIAVLYVVLFHCGIPGFGGGFTGVDDFFALSGYLITGLLVNEIEQTGKLSFRNFYARRVRRLLPASALMVVGTLLLGLLLFSPLEIVAYAKWASYTSLYISNYMFMRDAANYFAPEVATNPFLHTWTLAVEEQFYVLWPALIVLGLLHTKSRRRLAGILLGMCALSLGLCIWLTYVKQPWAFFSLPTRAWEFGLGGIASLIHKRDLVSRPWMNLVGWLGIAMILAAGCFYSRETNFPGYAAILPVGGTVLTLLAGSSAVASRLQVWLAGRLLQHLGKLSYSWYLWHWPILLFASVSYPSITWWGKLLAVLVALLIAQLSFWLLEKPIRTSGFLMARPALSLTLALAVPFSGVLTSNLVEHENSISLASSAQAPLWSAANDHRILFSDKCLAVMGVARVAECEFGDTSSSTAVVLFGDSHAEQWFPALQPLADERHWRLVTLLKSSCPAARVETYSTVLKREDHACWNWREAALRRIVQLQAKLVIFAESDGYVSNPLKPSDRTLRPQKWEDGIRATLSFLDSHGVKTLVIADVPRAEFNVPICLSRARSLRWASQPCILRRDEALNNEARAAEAVAVRHTSAKLLDFADSFCTASVCQPIIGGQIVYRDSNHLTSSFAKSFSPSLEQNIEAVLAQ